MSASSESSSASSAVMSSEDHERYKFDNTILFTVQWFSEDSENGFYSFVCLGRRCDAEADGRWYYLLSPDDHRIHVGPAPATGGTIVTAEMLGLDDDFCLQYESDRTDLRDPDITDSETTFLENRIADCERIIYDAIYTRFNTTT